MTSERRVSVELLLFLGMILTSAIVISNVKQAAATTPNFSISANPTSVIVNPGPQGNSTITLSSQLGFAGRVNMTVNVSPHGLYCQLNEVSLNVTANGTNSTMLHCDGFPGTFSVTVLGNGTRPGTIAYNQVVVNYVVPDFSLSVSPTSISLQTGREASTVVTIRPGQGFTQNVYLNLTLPLGIDGSITPSILSGQETATLDVNSTTTGVYNLTIVAASGSVSHELFVEVTVTNPPIRIPFLPSLSGGRIFGLRPLVFYTAIVALIVVGSAGAAVLLQRRNQIRKREGLPAPESSRDPA